MESVSKSRVELLLDSVSGMSEICILTHTNPDPDAIASAYALCFLLTELTAVRCQMVYTGIIGRAENKALVRHLHHPFQQPSSTVFSGALPVVMVDTQPGAGNNKIALKSRLIGVIDHHPWRDETANADYHDVRADLGAACTILVEYLLAADVEISPVLATALFYGIKTDTRGLGRNAAPADTDAYYFLQPRINTEMLSDIEQAQVPVDYFRDFHRALGEARVFDRLVVSNLGPVRYPDLTAEIADLLLRLEGSHWVVCMGVYEDVLTISVRTRARSGAGSLMRRIVGREGVWGGHGTLAGGQILLRGRDAGIIVAQSCERLLRHFGIDAEQNRGRPLLGGRKG